MAAQRSVNLDLGFGQTVTAQLGSIVPRIGVVGEDEVLYPAATGGVLVAQESIGTTLVPGASRTNFFIAVNLRTTSFDSANVVYSGTGGTTLLTLPYTGVPSVYRVRFSIGYGSSSSLTGTVTTEVDMVAFDGTPFTRSFVGRPTNTSLNYGIVEYTGPIREVTRVRVTNNASGNIFVPSQTPPNYVALAVIYLGTL